MQTDGVVEVGMMRLRRAQDVGGQPPVAGAGFDQVEAGSLKSEIRNLKYFGELDFEELAEQRPDVDAGKKIARAAGSLGRAGVVAELGIVEREVHERGHRQGAALTNHISNRQSAI